MRAHQREVCSLRGYCDTRTPRSEIEIMPNIFLSARLASTTSHVRQEKSSSTFAPGSTRSTRSTNPQYFHFNSKQGRALRDSD